MYRCPWLRHPDLGCICMLWKTFSEDVHPCWGVEKFPASIFASGFPPAPLPLPSFLGLQILHIQRGILVPVNWGWVGGVLQTRIYPHVSTRIGRDSHIFLHTHRCMDGILLQSIPPGTVQGVCLQARNPCLQTRWSPNFPDQETCLSKWEMQGRFFQVLRGLILPRNSLGVQDWVPQAWGAPAPGGLQSPGNFTLPMLFHQKQTAMGTLSQFMLLLCINFCCGNKFEYLWHDRRYGCLLAFTLCVHKHFYGSTKMMSISL